MSIFGNRRQAEPGPGAGPQPRPDMPQPAPAPQAPVGFETVLGANSTMEGTLRSGANIRLDGTFTGTLEVTGNVLVGETAKINADINARNVSIAGAVRGNISGKKVQLLRTGRVWGDIHATALTTEEGAFIDGKITMVSPDNQPAAGEEPMSDDKNTPKTQPRENQRIIEEISPHGMGALAEEPEEMFHGPNDPEISNQGTLVDNISAEDANALPAQNDAPEGQRQADFDAEDHSNETRQST